MEIVDAVNQVGATPSSLIAILEALKKSGSLRAELKKLYKMENIINGARSSLDFAQLGELKGRAQRREDSALRETAQQFEAMFLQMMLKLCAKQFLEVGLWIQMLSRVMSRCTIVSFHYILLKKEFSWYC